MARQLCTYMPLPEEIKRRNSIANAYDRLTKQPKDRRVRRKRRKLVQTTSYLSRRLIGSDPIHFFAKNCKETISPWVAILRRTTPPADITSSDPRFVAAFRFLDTYLCSGGQGTSMLRRLAYFQHLRLSDSLEAIIKTERANGVPRKSGYRDISIVMDIYERAQVSRIDTGALRRTLYERRRTSRGWTTLAGPSPLFLLVYSDVAETIIHRSSGVDKTTMATLAANVYRATPSGLVDVCARITELAEAASRSGRMEELHKVIKGIGLEIQTE
ncbi:hypothetical protein GGR55DRAFT_324178 [Xylaria sp. FL0064]|nr:hypothetical protein GGR55DRAFT_324178 [Xylaria sp. FL0064]